jgi:hypothetical protein
MTSRRCCCEDECPIWNGTKPATIDVTFSGVANEYCTYWDRCLFANNTFELDWSGSFASGPYGNGICSDHYHYADQDSGFSVGVDFYRESATVWKALAGVSRSLGLCGCWYNGSVIWLTAIIGGQYTRSSLFETGETLTLGDFVSSTRVCDSGEETACDISSAAGSIDT